MFSLPSRGLPIIAVAPIAPFPPPVSMTDSPLDALRREIDAIDDDLHRLIMRRSEVVGRIALAKAANGDGGTVALRPGREAVVLRRLLERHRGPFPAAALVRLWRELMGAFTQQQTPLRIAICRPVDQPGYWDLARDHFGSQIPLVAHDSAAQVLAEVRGDPHVIGVVPAPIETDVAPWWPLMASREAAMPNVIARLPFVSTVNARARDISALVLARLEPEASGDDRSLLLVESPGELSRSRLTAALQRAGFAPFLAALDHGRAGVYFYLLEVPGVVADSDTRLAAVAAALALEAGRVLTIGAYASPPTLAR
jgi:chorismate mutase/prephenate dehydratase